MSDITDVVTARITIERKLGDAGDVIAVTTEDETGEPLALVDALGILRFAEDTVIRECMGETVDDGEDDE